MKILNDIAEMIFQGNDNQTEEMVLAARKFGIPAVEILEKAFISTMNIVGEKFKNNEIYLPEVLISANAMKAGLRIIKPELITGVNVSKGTIIIGTIKGDLHDIGKNIVAMLLEGAGYKIIDLGIDVSPQKFFHTAIHEKASIVGLSALLTTTMNNMQEFIDLLKKNDLQKKILTIIGGAPVTKQFATSIGADGYAPDAATAVELVNDLIKHVKDRDK